MSTMNDIIFVFTILAAVGCGLLAGLLFAFSICIMKALSLRPAAEGIAAMQSINVTIGNPLFGAVFLGTTGSMGVVIVAALTQWQKPASIYLLLGGIFYMVGGFLVTILFNVPKNNALAAAIPSDPASAEMWANYLTKWTAWNHLRTVAAVAALVALIIALSIR